MRVNIFHLCLFCFWALALPLPAEVIAQVDYFYADDGTLVGNSRYSSDVYEPSVKFQVQLHFNT
jgi:hypothetical protein